MTFNQYQNLGGVIDDTSIFNKYYRKARNYVDLATGFKVRNVVETHDFIEDMQYLLTELIDLEFQADNSSLFVNSESVNGHSITYSSEAIKNKDKYKEGLVSEYLSKYYTKDGIKVTYRGRC